MHVRVFLKTTFFVFRPRSWIYGATRWAEPTKKFRVIDSETGTKYKKSRFEEHPNACGYLTLISDRIFQCRFHKFWTTMDSWDWSTVLYSESESPAKNWVGFGGQLTPHTYDKTLWPTKNKLGNNFLKEFSQKKIIEAIFIDFHFFWVKPYFFEYFLEKQLFWVLCWANFPTMTFFE